MNENVIRLKEVIKAMASEQKEVKENRKTVNFKGERKMNPSIATYDAQVNSRYLRHYYLAYASLRGVQDLSIVDQNYKDCSVDMINEIVSKYEEAVCTD